MPGSGTDGITPADLASVLQHALAVTGLAAALAVPVGIGLARLPAGWAATLAVGCLLAGLLPLPGLGASSAEVAALLPWVALPLGWGLRRMPAATLRIAASLAAPVRVAWCVWLPLAAPWLLTGLALGFARALQRIAAQA